MSKRRTEKSKVKKMPTPRNSDDAELATLYVALMLLVSFLGSRFAGPHVVVQRIYRWLALPWFAPPAALFGIAWFLVVYPTRGVALWLLRVAVGELTCRPDAPALLVSGLNLAPFVLLLVACAVEIFWSFAFFGKEHRTLGVVVIFIDLALLVAAMVLAFVQTNSTAAGVLIAVGVAWVAFAAVLAAAIDWKNRGRGKYRDTPDGRSLRATLSTPSSLVSMM
jgi:tryptophan-rich sensory protein